MRIFLSAGEPSGDLHGANLVRTLRHLHPGLECVGFGGEHMEAAGLPAPLSAEPPGGDVVPGAPSPTCLPLPPCCRARTAIFGTSAPTRWS